MKTLDNNGLSEIFDIDPSSDVEKEEDEFELSTIDTSDDGLDSILSTNIERANRILDSILNEVNLNQTVNDRLAKSAADLVNAITQSVNSIRSNKFNKSNLFLKHRSLIIKEEEVKAKLKLVKTPSSRTNILILGREQLLEIMKNSPDIKFLEDKSEENIT